MYGILTQAIPTGRIHSGARGYDRQALREERAGLNFFARHIAAVLGENSRSCIEKRSYMRIIISTSLAPASIAETSADTGACGKQCNGLDRGIGVARALFQPNPRQAQL